MKDYTGSTIKAPAPPGAYFTLAPPRENEWRVYAAYYPNFFHRLMQRWVLGIYWVVLPKEKKP